MNMKFKVTSKLLVRVALILGGIGLAGCALAAGDSGGVALTAIQTNVGKSVVSLAKILQDVSLISGVGFVLASFFKFHQHKLSPQQVPLSQGITLLLIGAGLLLFPTILPTTTQAVFGTSAHIAKTSGGAISKLISG